MSEELQDWRQKIKIQGKQEIGARSGLRSTFPLGPSWVLSDGLGFSQGMIRGVAQLYCRGPAVLIFPALRAFPNAPGRLWVVQPQKGRQDTNWHPCATGTLSGMHMTLNTQYLELLVFSLSNMWWNGNITFFSFKKTHTPDLYSNPSPDNAIKQSSLIVTLIIYSVYFCHFSLVDTMRSVDLNW